MCLHAQYKRPVGEERLGGQTQAGRQSKSRMDWVKYFFNVAKQNSGR